MDILFSVVSHGQMDLVKKLITSIDKFIFYKKCIIKIIITENLESEIDVTSSRFEIIKKINLRKKGFGDNHNCVFEQSKSNFFFIINPDVEFLHPVDFDLLITQIIERNLDIASPLIVNKYDVVEDYKRTNITPWTLVKRIVFKKKEEKFDWFAGIFLVIDSKSYSRLNGFDNKFYIYVEDCDLCMRARKLGMNIGDIHDFKVFHDARRNSFKSIQHFMWHISSLFKYWFKKY